MYLYIFFVIICCMQYKNSVGFLSNLFDMFRVKIFGYDSPRSILRLFEQEPKCRIRKLLKAACSTKIWMLSRIVNLVQISHVHPASYTRLTTSKTMAVNIWGCLRNVQQLQRFSCIVLNSILTCLKVPISMGVF